MSKHLNRIQLTDMLEFFQKDFAYFELNTTLFGITFIHHNEGANPMCGEGKYNVSFYPDTTDQMVNIESFFSSDKSSQFERIKTRGRGGHIYNYNLTKDFAHEVLYCLYKNSSRRILYG